jgi:hypothetical protein
MKTFLSVCIAGVVAGILTAAAATNGTPRREQAPPDVRTEVNRTAKTDRLARAGAGTIRVRTISITAPQEQAAERALDACESLVSPLADRLVSRRARHCAT